MAKNNEKNMIKIKELFEDLFETEDGKQVLALLYKICVPSLGTYEKDTHKAAFHQGCMHVLMHILKMAKISKEVFFTEAIKDYETLRSEWIENIEKF